MTNQKHTVATDALETLGKCPIPDNSGRDAIHLAVEPVVAGMKLESGTHIGLVDGKAYSTSPDRSIGIVDPFVKGWVQEGQRFWLVVLPRTITSLRHVWSHPAFPEEPAAAYHEDADDHYVPLTSVTIVDRPVSDKTASEAWMRAWAMRHMSNDYYGGDGKIREEEAYQNAIRAGEDLYVGPYESAGDHINDEWWHHWEIITGKVGKRGEYFSCSC